VGFWRDASGRLTFDLPGVASTDYPVVIRGLADALGLASAGKVIIGQEQMFWDFRRGGQVVGLDWDIWTEFMVVAKSEPSEPLVRPGRARDYSLALPQIRTCAINASGSSTDGLAARP